MGLVLHVEPRRCWTELTLERRFEGWDGIAHGGILCTILDEVMAWSLVGEDNWGLTARINVEFKKPVEIGEPIRAEGWITRLAPPDRRHGRPASSTRARTRVFATATGVYVAADEARKHELRAALWLRPPGRATRRPATPR